MNNFHFHHNYALVCSSMPLNTHEINGTLWRKYRKCKQSLKMPSAVRGMNLQRLFVIEMH